MNLNFRTSSPAQQAKRIVGRFLCKSVESFIFVATPGRTGTKTLFNLCETVPDCAAFHEPAPAMNGSILNAYSYKQDNIVNNHFRELKLPAIYKASHTKKYYVETNHTFIKCFSDAAVTEFGNRLKVIHLLRDRHAVARSWLKWSAIPGKGFQGPWLPDPFAPRHHIQYGELLKESSYFEHDYFKCLWYCYETEAKVIFFEHNYPQIPVYKLNTEDLNNGEVLMPIFYQIFGQFETQRLSNKIGTRSHSSKQPPKEPVGVDQRVIADFDDICLSKLSELKLKLQSNMASVLETAY